MMMKCRGEAHKWSSGYYTSQQHCTWKLRPESVSHQLLLLIT